MSVDMPRVPSLTSDARADVCIVGAGIAGLTTAYLLLRAGRKVLVLDRAGIGAGETARTTAHLASGLDDGVARIARLHGEEKARLAVESHADAHSRLGCDAMASAESARFGPENFAAIGLGVPEIGSGVMASARFEHDDRASARGQFTGDEAAARAGADDQHVWIVLGHGVGR
jgi:glycine/D-amino acid oxidase-like deaminating enzyme